MSIRERIGQETKESMKARDELRLSVLRMLSAAIHNREIEKRSKSGAETELTEEEIVSAIRSELKKRLDAVSSYAEGGRADSAKKEEAEAEILRTFLPPELSEGELVKLVNEGRASTGASSEKDVGKLTGWVMQKVKGQVSGDRVMSLVKKELGIS